MTRATASTTIPCGRAGYTLIPLNLYFKKGKVKVTVALVTGKKLYDKRQALAEKEAKRDIERRMKSRNY